MAGQHRRLVQPQGLRAQPLGRLAWAQTRLQARRALRELPVRIWALAGRRSLEPLLPLAVVAVVDPAQTLTRGAGVEDRHHHHHHHHRDRLHDPPHRLLGRQGLLVLKLEAEVVACQ